MRKHAIIHQMPSPASLEGLIRGCLEKNRNSEEQLYRYLYPDMIRVAMRYAGDLDGAGIIVNNAMLRIFRALDKYQEQGQFDAWVRSITVHCSLDFLKQQKRFRFDGISTEQEEAIAIPNTILNQLSAKDLHQLLQQLPKSTATVFNLFIYEGYSHKEIAELLDISEGTSKWHVNEGRRILKQKIQNFLSQ